MSADRFFPNGPCVLPGQYRCTRGALSCRFGIFLAIHECRMFNAKLVRSYQLRTLFVPLWVTPPGAILSHGKRCKANQQSRQENGRRGRDMTNAFQSWVGQAVVLQVALGDIKVPLRGKLLKDGDETVRMRIGEGWDVDIYKVMIMAVEADAMALVPAVS